MFTIVIENSNGEVIDEHSFEDGEFIAGRSQHCDIILPSPNISRRHARIFVQADSAYVEDLGSSNGVYVEGLRISGTTDLGRSAQMRIGDFTLHLEGTEPVQEPLNVCYGRLTVMSNDGPGRVFWLNEITSSVGRGRDANITILDPSISRIHARLNVDSSGRVFLEDLNASNGTYINGQRVSTSQVRPGDMIRLGHQDILFEGAPGDHRTHNRKFSSVYSNHEGSSTSITLIIALLVLLIGGGAAVLTFTMMNRDEDETTKKTKPQTEKVQKQEAPSSEDEEAFRVCMRRARKGRMEGDIEVMKSGVECASQINPSNENVKGLKLQLGLEEYFNDLLNDASQAFKNGEPHKALKKLQAIKPESMLYSSALQLEKLAKNLKDEQDNEFKDNCESGRFRYTPKTRCLKLAADMLINNPTDTKLLKLQRRWKK